MERSNSIFVWLAVVQLSLAGCASGPGNSGASDIDSRDVTADAGDARGDANNDTDTRPNGAYDTEPWLQEPGDCGSPSAFEPAAEGDFAKPDHPDMVDRYTEEEFWESSGRSTLQAVALTADNKHEPVVGLDNTTIYGTPGEDAIFHLAMLNNYDDLSSFQFSVTAMVDYQPVEATYVRVSDDRQGELERFSSTTGIGFQADRKVELVDIRIPSAELAPGRMNEIAIALQTHTVERRPVGQFHRFPMFYGGWERPSKPCVHPAQANEVLRPEKTMRAIFSGARGFTFFGPFTDALEFRERKPVSPGESVRMYFSLLAWEQPKDYAMVPVLNGKPLGPVWWAEQSLHDPDDIRDPREIDARRYVDVTMPEEPGVYNFQVLMWPDPFEVRVFPDGTQSEDVVTQEIFGGSNHITFEVVEESGN